jgi:ligand-binding SRPBCC domain-containing protein
MKIFKLYRKQLIRRDVEFAWDFFSNPNNLSEITPQDMGFEVTSDLPRKMYAGLIITYKVRPLLGIPVTWVTEITHVREQKYFVDEQRFGPYRFWHHSHKFESVAEGTMMEDTVYYGLPFGIIGRIANWLFVRRRLEQIFDYRYEVLEKYFNKSIPETVV